MRKEIVEIIDSRIREVHVTKEDFSELKAIVRDVGVKVGELAEAQKGTEARMGELTQAQKGTETRIDSLTNKMEELAEAQKGTEARMGELAEAQKGTETRIDSLTNKMEELAEAQKGTEARMGELAEAQKGTETRIDSLTNKMGELAEAQKGTETRIDSLTNKIEELAEAQKRTETRIDSLTDKMEELAEAQKRTENTVEKLAKGLDATRTDLGGLSRSVSYSLENEAYRQLPPFLKERYNIDLTDRMVRLEMEGEEINIFAHGKRDGKDILIVGEAELKLSSVGKLRQLEKKVNLIKKHYPGDCVPLFITHFARPAVLDAAREKGIVVVQSFEW